jgi:predicted nuclease with TOPRIM domain
MDCMATALLYRVLLLAAVLGGGLYAADSGTAHAGLYDRVRDIFELPGEVDKLKEGYYETLEQLEAAKRQAEAYRQMQEQLMADNARLQEQNRQLTEAVEALKSLQDERSRQSGRIQRMIWTAVLLIAGYFGITRVARYVMRARSRE